MWMMNNSKTLKRWLPSQFRICRDADCFFTSFEMTTNCHEIHSINWPRYLDYQRTTNTIAVTIQMTVLTK